MAIMKIADSVVIIKKILFFRFMLLVLQFDENIPQNVTISLIFFTANHKNIFQNGLYKLKPLYSNAVLAHFNKCGNVL